MVRTLDPVIYVGFALDLVGVALLVTAFAVQPAEPRQGYALYAGVAVLLVVGAVMFYGFHRHAQTA